MTGRRHRSLGILCLGVVVVIAASDGANAVAAGPTGSITCSVAGGPDRFNIGIKFRPFLTGTPVPRAVVIATNPESSCDDTGVTGASAPITQVTFKLVADLPNGTCAALTSAPQFSKTHLRIRWRGLDPAGRSRTIAVSKAVLADATFDGASQALVLTTAPITKGAFLGETATLHLGIDEDVATFNDYCTGGAKFAGMPFGATNPSSLDVQ